MAGSQVVPLLRPLAPVLGTGLACGIAARLVAQQFLLPNSQGLNLCIEARPLAILTQQGVPSWAYLPVLITLLSLLASLLLLVRLWRAPQSPKLYLAKQPSNAGAQSLARAGSWQLALSCSSKLIPSNSFLRSSSIGPFRCLAPLPSVASWPSPGEQGLGDEDWAPEPPVPAQEGPSHPAVAIARLEGPYAILRDRPHDRLLHLASPNYLNMPRPHHQQQQHQQAQQHPHGGPAVRIGRRRATIRGLETSLASHLGAQEAVACPNDTATPGSVLAALLSPHDVVAMDQACSSGLQAAVACSGARLVLCAHSDPWDLERVLQEEKQRCRSTGLLPSRQLVVVEGVYGSCGDVAPLIDIAAVMQRHQGWQLVVDETHSLGVLGSAGRGACEMAGLRAGPAPGQVAILIGSLSTSLASRGAFLASDVSTCLQLRASLPRPQRPVTSPYPSSRSLSLSLSLSSAPSLPLKPTHSTPSLPSLSVASSPTPAPTAVPVPPVQLPVPPLAAFPSLTRSARLAAAAAAALQRLQPSPGGADVSQHVRSNARALRNALVDQGDGRGGVPGLRLHGGVSSSPLIHMHLARHSEDAAADEVLLQCVAHHVVHAGEVLVAVQGAGQGQGRSPQPQRRWGEAGAAAPVQQQQPSLVLYASAALGPRELDMVMSALRAAAREVLRVGG